MNNNTKGKTPQSRFYEHIRWPILIPCILLFLAGVGVELTGIATETKHFIAGILIGAGAGGAIAELASTFERMELRAQLAELREGGLAECRRAYRMGEFFPGFQSALAQSDIGNREVREFRALGEILGMRPTLELITEEAPANTEYGELRERVTRELVFVSESLPTFFDLGINVIALRGVPNGSQETAELKIVIDKVSDGLREAARYSEDRYLVSAWTKFGEWWSTGRLTNIDPQAFVLLFHLYLLLLGGRGGEFGSEFSKQKRLAEKLAKMPVGARDEAIGELAGELHPPNA